MVNIDREAAEKAKRLVLKKFKEIDEIKREEIRKKYLKRLKK